MLMMTMLILKCACYGFGQQDNELFDLDALYSTSSNQLLQELSNEQVCAVVTPHVGVSTLKKISDEALPGIEFQQLSTHEVKDL